MQQLRLEVDLESQSREPPIPLPEEVRNELVTRMAAALAAMIKAEGGDGDEQLSRQA